MALFGARETVQQARAHAPEAGGPGLIPSTTGALLNQQPAGAPKHRQV